MAIDTNLKLEIRAYYEANNLSYSKVAQHFEDMGHQNYKKSIEHWGRTDIPKWEKNRYTNIQEAIDNLVDETLIDDIKDKAGVLIKASLSNNLNPEIQIDLEDLDKMSQYAVKELIFKTLNKHSLSAMMAQNLKRSETFAKNSKTIGAVKIHHDMLTSTYSTIHGKQTQISLANPTETVINQKELADMTTQELKEMIDEDI